MRSGIRRPSVRKKKFGDGEGLVLSTAHKLVLGEKPLVLKGVPTLSIVPGPISSVLSCNAPELFLPEMCRNGPDFQTLNTS